jgi:bacterioferritin (cytochrome b1)
MSKLLANEWTVMSALLAELQNLLRLTQTESMVATTRRAQAASDDIARELAQNAQDAADRAGELADAIRSLGGVPNVVAHVLNRFGTATRLQLEQTLPLREALQNDLRLELELRERARFARALAQSAGQAKVARLLERIEGSHEETIDWIEHRLGEVASGVPSAIRSTPAQVAARISSRLAFLPARAVAAGVNRTVHQLNVAQDRTNRLVQQNVERGRLVAEAVGEGASAAREAFLGRTEERALEHGDAETAANVHRIRANVGALEADELPIDAYDDLTVADVKAALLELDDAADVRAVLGYEDAHRARKGVLNAAESRLDQLVGELIAH